MCRAIDEIRDEAKNEGEVIKSIQFAINLIKRGKYSLEEIAEDSGLTLEDVQELAAEINTPA
jgi:predicted HTH domain antitoxin